LSWQPSIQGERTARAILVPAAWGQSAFAAGRDRTGERREAFASERAFLMEMKLDSVWSRETWDSPSRGLVSPDGLAVEPISGERLDGKAERVAVRSYGAF
jgi:hypothetical protein